MDLSSSLDGNVLDGKSSAFFYVRLGNSVVLVYNEETKSQSLPPLPDILQTTDSSPPGFPCLSGNSPRPFQLSSEANQPPHFSPKAFHSRSDPCGSMLKRLPADGKNKTHGPPGSPGAQAKGGSAAHPLGPGDTRRPRRPTDGTRREPPSGAGDGAPTAHARCPPRPGPRRTFGKAGAEEGRGRAHARRQGRAEVSSPRRRRVTHFLFVVGERRERKARGPSQSSRYRQPRRRVGAEEPRSPPRRALLRRLPRPR
ncbi:hypothetical protein J1605_016039 [Eschrichtius robustus]|uniref:Uncharacterized protein n=1 Tax=Eschrichtius robustus TaxID=9764 RepID=A0AB34G8X6_ESCRO|nr:hypothetical protein J1605_016039 [Eschrichtius robustus]